ncbi:MAG: hypothetical protein KDJ51_11615 [Nitratireductor sp.]|nr:hypothetical protein [Nitratireductor sp.]
MKIIIAIAAISSVVAFTAPAMAEDKLVENYSICMGGAGKLPGETVTAACTYLIDEAAVENEVTGYFYAMRAIANSDRSQNCSDALKVKQLITDPKLTDTIEGLISTNCS